MSELNRRDFVKATGAAGAGLSMAGTASAISPNLDTDAGLQEAIVVFRKNEHTSVLDAFDLPKGRHDYETLPMSWTFLTGDQVSTLAEDDRVLHVSDVFELEYYNDAESRRAMQVDAAQTAYKGEGVDAVVIDSGIDGSHPDFQGRVESNYEYVDEPMGDRSPEMWVDIGAGDSDDIGHGTHCAGILAGDGAASEQDPSTDESFHGMAPKARISAYSVSQTIYLPYAVGAWDHMLSRKLDDGDDFDPVVCSNSYGVSRGNRYNPLDPLNVATWKAFEAGVVPVFAAGNDGPDKGTLNRYAKAPHVLGVGAGTKDKGVTGFSSRGWNQGDELPPKAGGGTLEAKHHDRGSLLSNMEQFQAVARDGGLTVDSGTLSATVGPGVHAPYVPGGASSGSVTRTLVSGEDFPQRADRISGTLSVSPDNQQVQVSFYRLYGDGTKELLARMGEEPVYIHKDIAFDIDGGYDIEVEFTPKNTAGASVSFDYEITDIVTFDSGSYQGQDLSQFRPLTLYRPGVVTHGNLVMSTIDPHDALAPLDTTSDGARHALYGRFSGTSMACPGAAGIAALVIEAGRDAGQKFVGYGGDGFDPADVIATIEAEATVPGTVDGANYTPANAGPGFVDADRAVTRAANEDFAAFSETTLADEALATVFDVTGSRDDDGSAFTGGQTNNITITVDGIENASEIVVYDEIPSSWSVVGGAKKVSESDGRKTVKVGTVSASDVAGDSSVKFRYFIEAPKNPSGTNSYAFGPAKATVAATNANLDSDGEATFTGQDTRNVVAGVEQPQL